MKPYELFNIIKWTNIAIFTMVAITIYESSVSCAILVMTALLAGFSISGEHYEKLKEK